MRWTGLIPLLLIFMLAASPAFSWWHYGGFGSHEKTDPISVGTSVLTLAGMIILQAGLVPRLGVTTWSPLTLATATVGVTFVVGDHIVVSVYGPHGIAGGFARVVLLAVVNYVVLVYLFLGLLPGLRLLDRNTGVGGPEALAILAVPSLLPSLVLLALQSFKYAVR